VNEYSLTRRPDGKYTDRRLEPLSDEMYLFAERYGMALSPRYHDSPSWSFTWQDGSTTRDIELLISERAYVELQIIPGASKDDQATGTRHFMKKPIRGYLIFLPVEKSIFLETLEMARRDAQAIKSDQLIDRVPLRSD